MILKVQDQFPMNFTNNFIPHLWSYSSVAKRVWEESWKIYSNLQNESRHIEEKAETTKALISIYLSIYLSVCQFPFVVFGDCDSQYLTAFPYSVYWELKLDFWLWDGNPAVFQAPEESYFFNSLGHLPCEFFTFVITNGLHWNLSNSKSSQFFRTLLSILADLSSTIE